MSEINAFIHSFITKVVIMMPTFTRCLQSFGFVQEIKSVKSCYHRPYSYHVGLNSVTIRAASCYLPALEACTVTTAQCGRRRSGVAVARFSRSTKLTYVWPG